MQRVQMCTDRIAPSIMSLVFCTLGLKTLLFFGARKAHPML
jgi:hypothetical protein